MTAKIIGAAIICSVCAYTGIKMSDRLKKRSVYLTNLQTALTLLETEISFGRNRLKKAFENVDKCADTRGLFKAAANSLEERGVKNAWQSAVAEKKDELYLTDADVDALLMLGTKLGMTDAENQIKNLRYARQMLDAHRKKAEEEYAKSGRLYRNGGILAGLFLVLILF